MNQCPAQIQLKEARKRGAAVMKERDDLAEALVAIEKKARLAVMKDQIGVDELADSSGLSGGRFVCYTFETCPGTVPE